MRGLVEPRQGVGAFVLRTGQPRAVDVLAELRAARAALTRAISALDAPKPPRLERTQALPDL